MRFMTSGALLLAVVATASSAAGQVSPVRIQGPIRYVQYGEGGSAKSSPRLIYSNTLGGGLNYLCCLNPSLAIELIDWGVITGSQDHDVVTGLALGYGTASPTTAFRYRIYDDCTGFCPVGETPTLFDISLTGLPGDSAGIGAAWVVSLDLEALGACFYLDEGSFGYSYTYLGDSQTGPLLAGGGPGNESYCDGTFPGFGCVTQGFGGIWCGFWLEVFAHDGNDTFPGGCGGGLALGISGPTCTGSTVSIEVSGAHRDDWWAVALGTSIGAGIGGALGGCPIDVVPVVPIRVMGRLPTQPLTFPATVSFASGLAVGLQVITKNPASGVFDSSNTEIINVP